MKLNNLVRMAKSGSLTIALLWGVCAQAQPAELEPHRINVYRGNVLIDVEYHCPAGYFIWRKSGWVRFGHPYTCYLNNGRRSEGTTGAARVVSARSEDIEEWAQLNCAGLTRAECLERRHQDPATQPRTQETPRPFAEPTSRVEI